MKSILQACQPRPDLLSATFNPEVFTANLAQVMDFYRGKPGVTENVYTDAVAFFAEATFPTQGMKDLMLEVFSRLAGDNSIRALHRLETSFGGGKSHTLIGCTHIAFRGTDLAECTAGILDPRLLPKPGEIAVVGIAGEELPVHKPKGKQLVPYTLWGEIAFQIGGKALYDELGDDATSHAAPGKNYFEKVLGGRKVLIMLDELAQYATRLEAARPDGAEQLAAFLMALHGYARTHSGVVVILTLASQKDAFATQTQRLTELVTAVRGEEVSQDEAVSLREKAEKDPQSVVARDATAVTPVQAGEISRVLAKRLFVAIDKAAATETAREFGEMYSKCAAMLPDNASRPKYQDDIVANYPFHPALIDFLNKKLATVDTFQGTRGVLRVLAATIRSLWREDLQVPLVMTSHLNLRDARIVGEVLGRTGSSDLIPVLNADVGGVDTDQLEGGRSNAQLADLHNPHPAGFPMHEWAWRVVFLHSLVGRDLGLQSELFGLTEQQGLLEVSFPGLTPPQIQTALEQIKDNAFYLRSSEGRYYASLDVSVNIVLARLRRSLANSPLVGQMLDATARKVVKKDIRTFHVEHDVSTPENVPDKKNRPVLALVELGAGKIEVDAFVTTTGPNRPRIQQNTVFLLVPDTVLVKGHVSSEDTLFSSQQSRVQEAYKRLQDLALWVVAMRQLHDNPQAFGINRERLDEQDFDTRRAEREQALVTAVTQAYCNLWFPSASGQIIRKEIKTGGGEGGESTIELIRQALLDGGELVTAEHTQQSHLMSLSQLFFAQGDTVAVQKVRDNFCCLRNWPVLDAPDVLDGIIRSGVSKGVWCLFRMGSDDNVRPDEFYGRDSGELPFNLDLSKPDYTIVTAQGANQRGWTKKTKIDPAKVKGWVKEAVTQDNVATVAQIAKQVGEQHGAVPEQEVRDAVASLVQAGQLVAFKGKPEQKEKPAEIITGTNAVLYNPNPGDAVLTTASAAQKGWLAGEIKGLDFSGRPGAAVVVPLLSKIGSLYSKGAKSKIDLLDIVDLELAPGGTLRLTLENIPPATAKLLSELLEVLAGVAKAGSKTEAILEIANPHDDCLFVKELRKKRDGGE